MNKYKISLNYIVYMPYKQYIPESFNSVISQTDQNFEYVLIVPKCQMKDFLALNLKLPKNSKIVESDYTDLSNNRNVGIANSNGEYIVHLDCDDVIETHYIEITNKLLEKYPNLEYIVYNSTREQSKLNHDFSNIVYSDNEEYVKSAFYSSFSSKHKSRPFLEINSSWAKVWKKKIIVDNKILFPLIAGQDLIFTKTYGLYAKNIATIESYISVFWRKNANSITETLGQSFDANLKINNMAHLIPLIPDEYKDIYSYWIETYLETRLKVLKQYIKEKKYSINTVYKFLCKTYTKNCATFKLIKNNKTDRTFFLKSLLKNKILLLLYLHYIKFKQ